MTIPLDELGARTGKIISFDTRAPSVLGVSFNGVLCYGVVSYDIALPHGDLASLHRQVFPEIMQFGVRDDPRSYQYLLIRLANGTVRPIGLPWINPETLVDTNITKTTVVIQDADTVTVERLARILGSLGVRQFTITQE